MLLLAVTDNIHGRNEGWFNWPTGSTDPALPIHEGLCTCMYVCICICVRMIIYVCVYVLCKHVFFNW